MATAPAELGGQRLFLLRDQISDAEAYGTWDALVALDSSGRPFAWCKAHDGDFHPESFRDYVDALRRRRSGAVPHAAPVRVDIDVTQACNAACTFCFSRPYQHGGYRGSFIGKEALREIVLGCAAQGVRTIRYCGGGDPLVHPHRADILRLPHQHGLKLCVITNADFLDHRLSEDIAEHVDNLHWSVNAASDGMRLKLHRPGPGANPLSESRGWIRFIVDRARARRPEGRLLIWATFLLLPENFREAVDAVQLLRDAGVDSVSFRPVYHGLHSEWTADQLQDLGEVLVRIGAMSDPPRFHVFVPSRALDVAANLDPGAFFPHCLSRELRTVVEATARGPRLQSCGIYRGNSETGLQIRADGVGFESAWQRFASGPSPSKAPRDCHKCIDVSMNVTLTFLAKTLDQQPDTMFVRGRRE